MLDVTELGVELSHTPELVMLLEDPLVNFLDFNIVGREELNEAKEKERK